MKKVLLIAGFFPATAFTLALSFLLLIKLPGVREVDTLLRQQVHILTEPPPADLDYTAASLPQVLGSFTEAIKTGDARPVIIRSYLRRYNSPLAPYAGLFVREADKHGLKHYLLPVAIAQQESNLGKKTPPECHNAWGWGIHSRGTLCFPDWETGIKTYIRDFSIQYSDILAIENEDEMLKKLMARYAPVSIENSNGSWAKGVKQFLNDMR